MATKAAPRIKLNAREEQLRGLLVGAAAHIDQEGKAASKVQEATVLRWAGGWVRDKLLGIESQDIDTAINNMTGEVFARKLEAFCQDEKVQNKHGVDSDNIGHTHVIKTNPEQSKHLETTTMRLFALDVDFVNLRKETYTVDSRNPQMDFGTAEEDALRRDATINALFYNLHTGEVEDYVGGLADLEKKLIRTPLDPVQTFMDDPLRILRLVRFASRLAFELEAETAKVMGDPVVLQEMQRKIGNDRVKISRERVGVEMEKMLKGQHPRESLQLIDKLGLYHAIFTDPMQEDFPRPDTSNWSSAYDFLAFLATNRSPGSVHDQLVRIGNLEAPYFSWVLAGLTPLETLSEPEALSSRFPFVFQAAKEGLKCPNKLSNLIAAAHRNRANIMELERLVREKDAAMNERERFGMAIRQWDVAGGGGQWHLQTLFAILVDALGKKPDEFQALLERWQRFLDHLEELDVMNVTETKRLLDGKQLAEALGVKPGKWMRAALDVVMMWQLRHPREAIQGDKAACAAAVEEVRRRKDELGIDL